MRTGSGAAWSGQPRSGAKPIPPLDSASRQMERDADATMTVNERNDYTGQQLAPDPRSRSGALQERPLRPLNELSG